MEAKMSKRNAVLIALAAVLAACVFALAGCSCSSNQAEPEEASSPAIEQVTYTVPNVLSLTQADAEKSIVSSGLRLGNVDKEASDTVPLGSVISQDPAPLTDAPANSMVNIVISTGKAEPADVTVPDLKGMTQDEAEKALSDIGLVGVASNPEESSDVDAGCVFKQSVDPGTTVKEGTKVAFTVALAPSEATVPGVIGMTKDDARTAIVNAGLGYDSTTSYDDSVAEGNVISQSIVAGTQVKAGTTVTVTISLGAKPVEDVTVPDVTTYSWSDAEAALQSAGLAARYTGDPAGTVVSQDVAAGTKVAPGTLVTVTLSTPVEMVDVPDLSGMTVTAAEKATDAVGLALDPSSSRGTVVDQWPAAGTSVEVGTTVQVTIDDSQYTGGQYIGIWDAERVSLEVMSVGGSFNVKINWGSSADESTCWEYTCDYVDGSLVCSSGGTKTNITSKKSEVEYDDGTATFEIGKKGFLTWKDDVENAGKGLKFEKEVE